MKTDSRETYDLDKPSHMIANDVLRRIENICYESGIAIAFGVRVHNAIDKLIEQYQEKLLKADSERP